ncbi:MAG: DUF1311 domain-containing protein [Synergistaceae bacterium]|nr:DUF1311 domain-containing protein [Synergistaceae bacterium]MBR0203214.1 DUF1311 domain-containing protein [Synergistaceae bacterium]
MKKFCSALLLVAILCTSAFALSDKEYGALLRNSTEFYEADQELNQVWNELKDELSARQFARVKKDQSEWIKNGRDSYAKRMMRKEGYSKAEAYTAATRVRARYLREKYLDY